MLTAIRFALPTAFSRSPPSAPLARSYSSPCRTETQPLFLGSRPYFSVRSSFFVLFWRRSENISRRQSATAAGVEHAQTNASEPDSSASLPQQRNDTATTRGQGRCDAPDDRGNRSGKVFAFARACI